MLVFIPLLIAYTTLWSSILIFRVPIPTPSPGLLVSAAAPSPFFSLVSAVEEINTVINSRPAASDLVYSVARNVESAWYLDAPPVSPSIFPPLNFPICVPSDWPPLSDFGYLGTGTCDQVSSTDLVVWDGPSESPNSPNWFASVVDDYLPEDVWYFAALVTSGIGFWLVCRLIAVAILKRYKPTSTGDHLAGAELTVPKLNSADSSTEPVGIVEESPVESVEESAESTPNGRAMRIFTSASFMPPVEQVPTHVPPSLCQCSSPYSPSPVPTPLIHTPLSPFYSLSLVTHKSPVSLPLSTDVFSYRPIPLWSPKPLDIVSFYDTMAGIEGRKNGSPPNEAFSLFPMKRGSSLPTSAFYMVTRDKDSDRLATLDRGIARRSSSVFSFGGARALV